MKTRMYSVYDRKTLVYLPPYFALTNGAAVRTISDAIADPNSMLSKHPNDFVLFCVGTFDDSSGQLEQPTALEHVVDCQSLVQALQQEIPFPDHVTRGPLERTERQIRPNGEDR